MKTVIDVLRGARERLAQGWVRSDFALDANGIAVSAHDQEACRWCAYGAIIAAVGPIGDGDSKLAGLRYAAVDEVAIALGKSPDDRRTNSTNILMRWNDGQLDVDTLLEVFDKAILQAAAHADTP